MAVMRDDATEDVGDDDEEEPPPPVTDLTRVSCRFVVVGECFRGNAVG